MELRYGTADENVRKRSIRDVILQERQKTEGTALSKASNLSINGQVDPYADQLSGKRQAPGRKKDVRVSMEVSLLCPSRAGEMVVVNAVNQLAEEGIRAEIFSPAIMLPPGTQESVLREMMHQICRTAFELGIGIGQVHAEVTQAVVQPAVVGTAAGTRFCEEILCTESGKQENLFLKKERQNPENGITSGKEEKYFQNKKRPGQDIVLAGSVGLEGSCILVSERAGMLQEKFPLSILARMDLPAKELCVLELAESLFPVMEADIDSKTIETIKTGNRTKGPIQDSIRPAAMVSLGDGGFFTGLWRLAEKTGCGIEVDLQAVPVLQETIEITNELGINPYAMRSAGSLLIAAQDGKKLAEQLAEKGKTAVRIGKLTAGRDRILRNREEVRYLDRPQTDALAQWLRDHPG